MRTGTRHTEVLLWTAQILLAGLFVFAGAAKLAMPVAVLEAQAHMSGRFLQFIAVCELLGAAGLILPGLLRIRQGLTPVAAAGLTIIMAGAVTVSVASVGIAAAILPFVTGLIAAAVAYKRWHLAFHHDAACQRGEAGQLITHARARGPLPLPAASSRG